MVSSDMMFLSLLLLILFHICPSISQQPPPLRGKFIDCGATSATVINGREWQPDTGYISAGTSKTLTTPTSALLSTVRSFPLQSNLRRKFCYVLPVYKTGKYLVRTHYYYGGINGRDSPPVFDQIVDGTLWAMVNTTEDYSRGMESYYEGVFMAGDKVMSVCLAANSYTDSDPFISALEIVLLSDSLYNSTDFGKYAFGLVARHSFGYNGSIISYPDDAFDRYWQPFGASNSSIIRTRDVSVSGFWNLPPRKIFDTEVSSDQPKPMELQWPPTPLPNSSYYVALYFANDRSSSENTRVFSISVNGIMYFRDLSPTLEGFMVFANQWPLSGLTNVILTPSEGSSLGPLINAGEVFEIMIAGGKTLTRDVIALQKVKRSFENPPIDWNGDPCLPRQYSWTGISCSEGPKVRVTALNLTSMGLSGSLSPSLANLTGLSDIWLGNNNLSGTIPDLSSLKRLQTLHLEENELGGEIPQSLGNIEGLHEVFLQDNKLTGTVPQSLRQKPGLNLKTSPGNPNLSSPGS